MSFVDTEKDKMEDLVRENAIVKCSQSDDEIKIIFPPWGILGGENNDIKQMMDVYTIKAGEKGACFDKIFDKCKSNLAENGKCKFAVYDLWQKVGTVQYINGVSSTERNEFDGISETQMKQLNTLVSKYSGSHPSSMNDIYAVLKNNKNISDTDRDSIHKIMYLANTNLPNVNENPGGIGFNLLMQSELPCFRLGYLYFK